MSYQPTGYKFAHDGEKYCLGIGEAGTGDKVFAIFMQTGNGWEAQLPVLKFGVTEAEIAAAGSPGLYLTRMLPLASKQMQNLLVPPKPPLSDNVACTAYDLALDVEYDPVEGFKFNKEPPLSHRR